MSKARDIADLGSNDVLETTSTGVDVTGTVTADGLTVDGDVAIDNSDSRTYSSSSLDGDLLITRKNNSGTNNQEVSLRMDVTGYLGSTTGNVVLSAVQPSNASSGDLYIKTRENGVTSNAMKIANNNDIHFFEDTGTTAKMVWDASAESLGIGTASPSNKLTIKAGDNDFIRLDHTSRTGSWEIQHSGVSSQNLAFLQDNGTSKVTSYVAGRDVHLWYTGGSERARITTEGTFDLAYKNLGSIATYTDTTYRHQDTFANLFFTTPADNVWRNVCAINNSYGTFTVTGSDTPSGDVAQYAYRITTVSYGVSMFSQVFYKEGGWNTGTFEFRVANVGGTQTLQMRYSSYYSSSNTGSFYINFNSLG